MPRGAQRNTQAPHVVAFEGVISVSRSAIPAPAISALQADYKDQVARIVKQLQALSPEGVTSTVFASMEEFTKQMSDLVAKLSAAAAT